MERREKALIAKSELQEGRLQQKPTLSRGPVGRPGSRAGNNANADRLKMLKSKKERLNHTLERLVLQAGHKVWVLCSVYGCMVGAGRELYGLLMKMLLIGEADEDDYELRTDGIMRGIYGACSLGNGFGHMHSGDGVRVLDFLTLTRPWCNALSPVQQQ